jgi:hypothetical protein
MPRGSNADLHRQSLVQFARKQTLPSQVCVIMINPAKEFQKHAHLCEHMAREVFNQDDKAAWRRMADRWGTCAKEGRARDRSCLGEGSE